MPHDQKQKVAGTTDPQSRILESGKGGAESAFSAGAVFLLLLGFI